MAGSQAGCEETRFTGDEKPAPGSLATSPIVRDAQTATTRPKPSSSEWQRDGEKEGSCLANNKKRKPNTERHKERKTSTTEMTRSLLRQ